MGAAEDEGLGVMEPDAPGTARQSGPAVGGVAVPQATGCDEEEQDGGRAGDERGGSRTPPASRQPHATPPQGLQENLSAEAGGLDREKVPPWAGQEACPTALKW